MRLNRLTLRIMTDTIRFSVDLLFMPISSEVRGLIEALLCTFEHFKLSVDHLVKHIKTRYQTREYHSYLKRAQTVVQLTRVGSELE